MSRNFCLIAFLLTCHQLMAQQNRVKLGAIGVPTQSGSGIGNIGYERLNKDQNRSWQILFSAAGGSIGNDAPSHDRVWVTAERVSYFYDSDKKLRPYYSLFVEAGKRKTTPGYQKTSSTSTLQYQKSSEVNPGVDLGLSFKAGKRFGIEIAGGPKLIIGKGKSYYYDRLTRQNYDEPFSQTKLGGRFFFSFFYQF